MPTPTANSIDRGPADAELTADELERVSGGKTVSWAYEDESPKTAPRTYFPMVSLPQR
jgi:hypothetical protein